MAELAPSGGGPNRLFIILAIGLGGLLILGLIGVGGFFIIQRLGAPAPVPTARTVLTTPTRVALAPDTATPTATTPTVTTPTSQASPTFVVVAGGTTDTPSGSATSVLSTSGPTTTPTPKQLPRSGSNDALMLLAGGIVLVLIVFAARRARTSGS